MQNIYLGHRLPQYFCQLNGDIFTQKQKPLLLQCCNSAVCSHCFTVFQKLEKCPLCLKLLSNKGDLILPSQSNEQGLLLEMKTRIIKCFNYNDCNWQGPLKKLIAHLEKECQSKCFTKQCEFIGYLGQMENHLKKCNVNQRVVTFTEQEIDIDHNQHNLTLDQLFEDQKVCQYCLKEFPESKLKDHENSQHNYLMVERRSSSKSNQSILVSSPLEKEKEFSIKSQIMKDNSQLMANKSEINQETNLIQHDSYQKIGKELDNDSEQQRVFEYLKTMNKKLKENKRAFFILYFMSLFMFSRVLIISFDFNYALNTEFKESAARTAMTVFVILEIIVSVFNYLSSLYNFTYYLYSQSKNGIIFVLRVSLMIGIIDGIFGLFYDIPLIVIISVNSGAITSPQPAFSEINLLLHGFQLIINIIYISSMICNCIVGTDPSGNHTFRSFLLHRLGLNIIILVIDLIFSMKVYDEVHYAVLIASIIGFLLNVIYQNYYWSNKIQDDHKKSQWRKLQNMVKLDVIQFLLWDAVIILIDQFDYKFSTKQKKGMRLSLTYIHIISGVFSLIVRPFVFGYYMYSFPKMQSTRNARKINILHQNVPKPFEPVISINLNKDIQLQFK